MSRKYHGYRRQRVQEIAIVFFLIVASIALPFLKTRPPRPEKHAAQNTTQTQTDTISLCAVIISRIYPEDLAQITVEHLLQWMAYMRYAGATHVYLYDTHQKPQERLGALLQTALDPRFVTYHDWGMYAHPFSLDNTQVTAYQHAIDHYAQKCAWQIALDVDEYPFSEDDMAQGFLQRYLKHIEKHAPDTAEISLQNYLLLGPMNTDSTVWLPEKYTRLTKEPGNNLVKPLYRPEKVKANMHHNTVLSGSHMDERKQVLRLAHVWGARIDNFQNTVSQHVLDITQEDTRLRDVIQTIKKKEQLRT
jgi:hypothetical protein